MAILTTFSLYATAWNLLYPGEAVLGRRWERRLGEGLPETRFFRLVLLEGGRAPRPAEVPDLRVAVLVPPSALGHAVREEARSYAVEQERGGEDPSHPLPDVRRYTNGRLVTREALGMDLSSLETPLPAQGLSALAAALFPYLTASPPLPVADLPRIFGPAEARLLWEGFASPRPSAQGRGAVQDFSRGLGLVASHVPSSVLDLLRQAVAEGGWRGASLENLRGRFARDLRLPPYMASLFGLLAVLWGDLEAEVGLATDVALPLFRGRARTARRIAAGILPAVPWTEELEQVLVAFLPPLSLTWASLRPYLDLLTTASGSSPGEPPLEDDEAIGLLALRRGQLKRLKAALVSLGEQPLPGPDAGALEHFLYCLEARTPEELLARIKGLYPTIVHLAQDAEAVVRIEQMDFLASQSRAIRSYLQEAVLGSTDADMEMDRESLLHQLSLSSLMASPGLWPGIQARFDLFRCRYATRYAAAHASHHGEMERLYQRLQDASLEVAALERLNRIQELGEPVGEGIVAAHSSLLEATRPCPVRAADLAMNEAPLCQECHYALAAPVPEVMVERHLRGLETARGEQFRRLSSEAVRQVLARSGQEGLDRLLQAAQASDLTSLSQVLDDELAAFLAELLRSSPVRVPRRSILERLRERFPTVGEDEVNLCAAELAILLREAFEEARREDSNPSLRLTLS